VIPTLNEEDNIRQCLDCVLATDNETPPQVIVVDAGSSDGTCALVASYPNVILVQQPDFKGLKYSSLNHGAALANGDVVIFLDADTLLPKGYQHLIKKKLSSGLYVGGAFEHSFDQWTLFLRFIHLINRIRYRISQRYYGDQAVFCKSEVFRKIGGFPEINIMESARFCDRMKTEGKLCLVLKPIITSSRRFLEQGQVRVFLNDVRIWLMDWLGLSLDASGRAYWSHNHRE
jgi:glycosyltransferase involved in cell wall biosynthesis